MASNNSNSTTPFRGTAYGLSPTIGKTSAISLPSRNSTRTRPHRPYKFLQATDKKTVDKDTRGATAAMRKQFAVLVDFNEAASI